MENPETTSLRVAPSVEQQQRANVPPDVVTMGMKDPHALALPFRMGSCSPYIERALTYVLQNYSSPIQVPDMAAKASMSQYHFIRRFKAEVGQTPHRFLMSLRVSHAKAMLVARPDLKVKDVGCFCGYNDPTAFTRVFRRQVGLTPRTYRTQELREAARRGSADQSSGADSP